MASLSKMDRRKQKRLYDQLDFFGAKKRRYVSVYANKPRIRMKGKQRSYVHEKVKLIRVDDILLHTRPMQEEARARAQGVHFQSLADRGLLFARGAAGMQAGQAATMGASGYNGL